MFKRTNNNNIKPKVTIISFAQSTSFSLSCAQEVFCNNLANVPAWYDVNLVKFGQLTSFDYLNKAVLYKQDTLVITDYSCLNQTLEQDFLSFLVDFYNQNKRIVAIGSGIFVLAKAGLLNGQTVAADTGDLEQQQLDFPLVKYCGDLIFSAEDNIYCCSASAAALQLAVHLVQIDFGIEVAANLAKKLHISPVWQESSSIKDKRYYSQCSKRLIEALEWAENNLEDIVTFDQLAYRACMSRRSFDRQFRAAFNQSPKEWLTQKRLNLAIRYLEDSKLCIEEIADASGFGSAVNFRNNFRASLGISPTEYRSNLL